MAQLDVFLTMYGDLVVDVQSDLFDHFETRVVVPLLDPTQVAKPIKRLNPTLTIDGKSLVLYPQLALAVPESELTQRVGSLADDHFVVMSAVDMLWSGI